MRSSFLFRNPVVATFARHSFLVPLLLEATKIQNQRKRTNECTIKWEIFLQMTYISKEFTWRGCTKARFYFLFGVVFKDFAVTKVIIFLKLIPGLKYIRFEREFLVRIVVSTLNYSMRNL